MPFSQSKTPPDASGSGLKDEIASVARNAGGYLQARAELLAIEGEEATSIISKRLVSKMIAAFSLGIAYLSILIAGIALGGTHIAQIVEHPLANWMGLTFATGSIHLAIGLLFRVKARAKNTLPLFEYTRSEWEKDKQWIQQQNKSVK